MRHLSYWAQENKWSARFLLILFHGLLSVLAIFWGRMMAASGIHIPEELLIGMSVAVLLTYILSTISPQMRKNYRIRKAGEAFVLVTGVLLLSFVSCDLHPGPDAYQAKVNADNPHYAQFTVLKEKAVDKAAIRAQKRADKREARQEKRAFRKQLKAQIRTYLKANNGPNPLSSGDAFGLVLLSVLAGFALMYLSLVFGCSISCGGNEGLGSAVFVLGFLGGIGLMIFLIIRISQRRRATKEAEARLRT